MIKMYRVTIENTDPDENPYVYIVEEKEKNFLSKAFNLYSVSVEEIYYIKNKKEIEKRNLS